jgi:uncharacterized membrane protein YdbT with pleckstrin-like domain
MSFCGNCGNELGTNAKFCQSCGASVTTGGKKVKSGEDFSAQPVFEPIVIFMRYIIIGIFFAIWLGFFLGTFGAIAADKLGILPFYGFIFPGLAGFFFILIGIYISVKNNYRKTFYEFFDDRLTYYDGFWSRSKKELRYNSITEIGYTEGFFQRKYNLGTIVLSTPATDKKAGMQLRDLRDIETVYTKFKEKYNAAVG